MQLPANLIEAIVIAQYRRERPLRHYLLCEISCGKIIESESAESNVQLTLKIDVHIERLSSLEAKKH
jgi:hypothetical protein